MSGIALSMATIIGCSNEENKVQVDEEVQTAINVVEEYLLTEDIEQAKTFFGSEVYFPADEEPNAEHNPNQINFPNNYYYEWNSNEKNKKELIDFSVDSNEIYLYYKTTTFGKYNIVFKYTMTKEDDWKISKIEAVVD